jgi:hypothetical protein
MKVSSGALVLLWVSMLMPAAWLDKDLLQPQQQQQQQWQQRAWWLDTPHPGMTLTPEPFSVQ